MSLDYTDLIWSKSNSLSKDFCKSVIDKFEKDEHKYDGLTANGLKPEVKLTTDLFISDKFDWAEEDAVLHMALRDAIDEYQEYLKSINSKIVFYHSRYDFQDDGYKVQKYTKREDSQNSGFYDWHNDFLVDALGTRILVFMWYLNDVIEGGETEFANGLKIKPEAGKIVIFPSSWYIVHRGNKPISSDKIICNGWLYVKNAQ